ncbi:MAG: glycine cleavage T C-terminal barrel domain-containing protein, partial [Ruegeria sp.]
WGREYSQEYWPQEVGLAGLIKLDKDFLHKDAYLGVKDNAPREVLSILEVEAVNNADATGGEPIFTPDGKPVGRVTSGAYGYSVGKSLAIGYADPQVAQPGDTVNIFILGRPHTAKLLAEAPFDPAGNRLRDIAPMMEGAT